MPATVARIAAKGQHAIDSTVLWMKQTVSGPLVELRPEITAQTLDRFLTHAHSIQHDRPVRRPPTGCVSEDNDGWSSGVPGVCRDSALHKHRPGYNVKDNIYPAYDDLNIVALKPHGRERTLDE
ncbi:hypothetical protein NUW54_g238 [Trametes sanguinea]|uniref:Uncharacterized protein n=1 Tax=Trametes sanguinea TaxID=158606 RepID=A0ACC1Q9Q2_9APHY|nr:hypothetical protein NUW54_g238 [Trametes sanguinea]